LIYWCWSANSSGGKLTILTMRLAHHFAVWDFAFSISEPSRSRGHAADQIHQETLEKNHHHHHYYSLVIFYIYILHGYCPVFVYTVWCAMLVAAAKSNHYSKDAVSSFSPRHWWRRRPHKFICHSLMIFQCDRWGTGSAQEQTHTSAIDCCPVCHSNSSRKKKRETVGLLLSSTLLWRLLFLFS
jgi:hypothetical protein